MNLTYILIVLLALTAVVAMYQGLITRRYRVKSKKTAPDKRIRLALVSDVHCQNFGPRQKQLIKKLIVEKPDIILLCGDIIDIGSSMSGLAPLLENISKQAPVFYVTGNHEHRSEKTAEITDIAAKYGICLLNDEYHNITVNDTPLIVAGLNDPDKTLYEDPDYNQTKVMEEAFTGISDAGEFKILIAHRPELIAQYNRFSFDLVLSGHTHGGQVRLPFLINGLWAPDQGLFPKYGGGLYRYEKTTHIVSRGVCFRWRLPRIFNPPELVVIDIIAESS